jgi:prolyl-tRNA editing enzyme YbaK/EbsC (Cys-tRNA(Pro) deacylase)/Pyruvate/2-oxoacid:ferredoxin oxidoreductase delta subunit
MGEEGMHHDGTGDAYLEKRLACYDGWVREGKIPFSSRVIPVRESLAGQQWVVPTEQVIEFLRNARSFVLVDCECRTRYQRCDGPVETCFLINDVADAFIAEGIGRTVSIEEATQVLRQANEKGLVHLTIYNPDQYVYAVCSCCDCCCHDLQFLKVFGRDDLIARSEYVAHTDTEACIHCGDCIQRCVFGARTWDDGQMSYNPDACYGCGLCVTTCLAEATVMQRKWMTLQTKIMEILETHQISYCLLPHDEPVFTVEAAAQQRGVVIEEIVKSILLRDKVGHYVMTCVLGQARLDPKAVRAYVPSDWKRLYFASAEEIQTVTGCVQGAVAPLGLPEDVPVIFDEAIVLRKKVNISSGDPMAGLELDPQDLLRLAGAQLAPIAKAGE